DYFGLPIPPAFTGKSFWPLMRGDEPRISDMIVSAPNLSKQTARAQVATPKGKSADRHSAEKVIGEIPRPTDRATITDGRWFLVYSCAGWGDELQKRPHSPDCTQRRVAPLSGESLSPMLFDLEADPECLANVYAANKERAQDLHRRFFAFLD